MEDRFARGVVAGLIGGIIAVVYSFIAGFMGFTTLRIADWVAIFIFAHTPPFSVSEMVYATLGQLAMACALGSIFAFWIPQVTSRNLLFKGWFFSISIWFLLYAITTLFSLQGTVPTPFKTAVSNFVGATIFGLVQAYALQALTPQENTVFMKTSIAPAMKPLEAENEQEDTVNSNRNPQGG
ncbi:hypothetical protein [Sporomusa aerivorans]|uniref:hypothetical protein n=1 Tax=Sporomusa aerivorans TaxID=204936 RepID=UPI00352A0DEC